MQNRPDRTGLRQETALDRVESRQFGGGAGLALGFGSGIRFLTAQVAPPKLHTVNVVTGSSYRVSPDRRPCCVQSRAPSRGPGRPTIRQCDSTHRNRLSISRVLLRPAGLPWVESRQDGVHRWPLNIYGYRYYSPDLGLWILQDPIEGEGDMNLYWYVGNDGVDRWDVLGRLGWLTKPAEEFEQQKQFFCQKFDLKKHEK